MFYLSKRKKINKAYSGFVPKKEGKNDFPILCGF